MKKLIYAATIILCIKGFAQEELLTPVEPVMRYVQGQVVTLEGDTISGEIRIRNKGLTTFINRIQFRDENKKDRFYLPEEIKGFIQQRDNLAILGGSNSIQSSDQKKIYYDAFTHPEKDDKSVFVQRLNMGKRIRIYENPTGSTTSTSMNGFTVSEKERTYLVSKNGGNLIKLHKGQFESRIEELFYDCNSLKAELTSNEDLRNFRNLGEIVNKYNQCE